MQTPALQPGAVSGLHLCRLGLGGRQDRHLAVEGREGEKEVQDRLPLLDTKFTPHNIIL